MSPSIRGRATGFTPPSAGPASSRSSTWCNIRTTCASPACTCRRTPCSRSPKSSGISESVDDRLLRRRHHRRFLAFQLRSLAASPRKPRERARRRFGYVCLALALGLVSIGAIRCTDSEPAVGLRIRMQLRKTSYAIGIARAGPGPAFSQKIGLIQHPTPCSGRRPRGPLRRDQDRRDGWRLTCSPVLGVRAGWHQCAAKNLKGEGDSTWIHFDDTIYGGDFLANQPPVKAMSRGRSRCHRSARPHGRPFQSHARRPARFPPLRRHAL